MGIVLFVNEDEGVDLEYEIEIGIERPLSIDESIQAHMIGPDIEINEDFILCNRDSLSSLRAYLDSLPE
jgi:hypothetical protein